MNRRIPAPAVSALTALTLSALSVGLAPVRAGAHALALSPDGHRLYVSDPLRGIHVIDTGDNALLATLPIQVPSERPGVLPPLVVSPNGRLLYAETLFGPPVLRVINLTTGMLAADIEVVGREASEGDLTVSPDGSRLYMLAGDPGPDSPTLSVIDTTAHSLIATASVPGVREALTPDGRKLYVKGSYWVDQKSSIVSVFDTTTNRFTGTISVQSGPVGIAANPKAPWVYVTHIDPGSQTVDLINTISDEANHWPFALPGGESLAPTVSPDGRQLYVVPLPWFVVAAVSTGGNGVLGSGSLGPGIQPVDQVVSPDGERLYELNRPGSGTPDGSISVVDTGALQVIATINLAKAPAGSP